MPAAPIVTPMVPMPAGVAALGYPVSAIFGKPSAAKAAAPSNPHRGQASPLSRAFVRRRLSDAGPLYWVDGSRRAGIRNPSRFRPFG
jgi:hypothetical protein